MGVALSIEGYPCGAQGEGAPPRCLFPSHIKIDDVCLSGGMTTYFSGQSGFTIAHSRGNLIRNNSLVFRCIKPLYSNLNLRHSKSLICLSFSACGFFLHIIDFWFFLSWKGTRSSKARARWENWVRSSSKPCIQLEQRSETKSPRVLQGPWDGAEGRLGTGDIAVQETLQCCSNFIQWLDQG